MKFKIEIEPIVIEADTLEEAVNMASVDLDCQEYKLRINNKTYNPYNQI